LVFPGLIHLYVLWHLRSYDASQSGPRGRRNARWARAISYGALAVALLLLGWALTGDFAERKAIGLALVAVRDS
jgi:hypothetical protein